MDAIHYKVREERTVVTKAAYPRADIQRCIIHQICSSTKYLNWKDMNAFMADLKRICGAITEDEDAVLGGAKDRGEMDGALP